MLRDKTAYDCKCQEYVRLYATATALEAVEAEDKGATQGGDGVEENPHPSRQQAGSRSQPMRMVRMKSIRGGSARISSYSMLDVRRPMGATTGIYCRNFSLPRSTVPFDSFLCDFVRSLLFTAASSIVRRQAAGSCCSTISSSTTSCQSPTALTPVIRGRETGQDPASSPRGFGGSLETGLPSSLEEMSVDSAPDEILSSAADDAMTVSELSALELDCLDELDLDDL
ncbi:Ubiquitin-conjugating enzyme E2 H, variant 2 [Perkinsus olseni]|uniref:Ubiquitin-conjugating enzyme E2 H, variant 2 n=1 Tax=Perkinsus olseni TaxID=32597 RepID=A0A7J6NXS6_PEROL|nr:Ubiquitin-conjugating enzyme E2 H, variant 2 [Perkinsus olseni]